MKNNKIIETVEKKVKSTIRKYKLIDKREKIGVAVSGGKDSTVCLYLLKKFNYNVEAITIDANIGDYTQNNLSNIKSVCKKYKIKLHTVSFTKEFGISLCYIKDVLNSKGYKYSSCMICGILKRYLLNKYSKKLKFDSLATGHNLDDEAQSFVMNVFRNDFKLAKKQGPKSESISKHFIKRIKPLYEIKEEDILEYSKIMNFKINYDICPCSTKAYRREYKNILDTFEKNHPSLKYNIIKFQETLKENLKEREHLEIGVCEICGEPSSNKVCKTCIIFKELKENKIIKN
jgi:uncharacterized protein (TIGR00269 family)